MPRVIEWLKRYEDPDRVELPADVENLVQTDETLGWCIEELERSNRASIWRIRSPAAAVFPDCRRRDAISVRAAARIGAIPAFISSYLSVDRPATGSGFAGGDRTVAAPRIFLAAIAAGNEEAELEREAIVEIICERGGMAERAKGFVAEHLPGVELAGRRAFCGFRRSNWRGNSEPVNFPTRLSSAGSRRTFDSTGGGCGRRRIGSARALPAVLKRMDDASPAFRTAASEVLSRLRSGEAAAASLRLTERERRSRIEAIFCLAPSAISRPTRSSRRGSIFCNSAISFARPGLAWRSRARRASRSCRGGSWKRSGWRKSGGGAKSRAGPFRTLARRGRRRRGCQCWRRRESH